MPPMPNGRAGSWRRNDPVTASCSIDGVAVRGDGRAVVARDLAEEVAVALVYQQTTQAVLMATPADLEDLATGFSLTEGIVAAPGEIESIEIAEHPHGIEARMWLAGDRAERLAARRRHMAGPVGCGLCGIESLAEAVRPLPALAALPICLTLADLAGAPDVLRQRQPLHDRTGAVHAAGFLTPGGLLLVREDVGRHNALDKLVGAMARRGIDGGPGAVVMTSRISIELVQKCAMARVPVLVAVSAPTAHAVRIARDHGMVLAASARSGRLDLYAGADRFSEGAVDGG